MQSRNGTRLYVGDLLYSVPGVILRFFFDTLLVMMSF